MTYEFERIYRGTEDFPIGIFSQNSYLPEPHHHIEYEIFYLDKGEAVVGIDKYEFKIHAGNVVFINPGTQHYITKTESKQNYHYYAIVFDSSVIGHEGDSIRNLFESIRISRCITLPDLILTQVKNASEAAKKHIFGHELLAKTVLFEIISYIVHTKQYVEISDQITTSKNHSINAIDVTLKYVREHYRESITMDDLLEITSYSKSHFIRLFKKYTGMNVTDYINKYRIEKSCLDLIYTNKNITEIATENGFNTVQYFSKIFKEYMNCTPKKYQKEGRNIIIPSSVATRKE